MADKVNAARGAVEVFVPRHGVSELDAPGKVFYDKEADAALFHALHGQVAWPVVLREMPCHINDPAFGLALAASLHALISSAPVASPHAAAVRGLRGTAE